MKKTQLTLKETFEHVCDNERIWNCHILRINAFRSHFFCLNKFCQLKLFDINPILNFPSFESENENLCLVLIYLPPVVVKKSQIIFSSIQWPNYLFFNNLPFISLFRITQSFFNLFNFWMFNFRNAKNSDFRFLWTRWKRRSPNFDEITRILAVPTLIEVRKLWNGPSLVISSKSVPK